MPREPNWNYDEHVLALDYYVYVDGNPPNKTSDEIIQLSNTLQQLARRRGHIPSLKFRNANGVYMKLMNFRRLDWNFSDVGQTGLSRGSGIEEIVFDRFFSRPAELRRYANSIRDALSDRAMDLTAIEEEEGAVEGSVLMQLHKRRERSGALVRKKCADTLRRTGKLVCEVCGLDFNERYGEHGEGFIKVHHTVPLASMAKAGVVKLKDLSCVCSNCHRMLHRNGLQTIEWLRTQLR